MRRSALFLAVLFLAALGAPGARAAKPAYPVTQVMVVNDTLHGTIVPDPYRWLEDADNPSVKAWTAAQNAYDHRDSCGSG